MLRIRGRSLRMYDRVNRRSFLGIGTLGLGGLTLADVLRAEARAASPRPKSVILVFLPGGPSHLDLVDLKPAAPVEIRGEFGPIDTAVPGIQISELLPNLAAAMDKLAVVRTIVGGLDEHACHSCLPGHSMLGPQPPGSWPTLGAVISQLLGSARPALPPAIGLAAKMLHPPYNDPGPGFLGAAFAPFSPDTECRENMVLQGVNLDRLNDRRALLEGLDRFRRALEDTPLADGVDAFQQQAFALVTGRQAADALDVSFEDERTRALYGPGDASLVPGFNAAPKLTEQFLIARRLVEAGVRCVTLAFGAWDWHEKNFSGLRQETPPPAGAWRPWIPAFASPGRARVGAAAGGGNSARPPESTRRPGAIIGPASRAL